MKNQPIRPFDIQVDASHLEGHPLLVLSYKRNAEDSDTIRVPLPIACELLTNAVHMLATTPSLKIDLLKAPEFSDMADAVAALRAIA